MTKKHKIYNNVLFYVIYDKYYATGHCTDRSRRFSAQILNAWICQYPSISSLYPTAVNSEIALNNISIKNAILTASEQSIILHEKDLISTLNILAHIRSWAAEK